jgi:hypothetical protein
MLKIPDKDIAYLNLGLDAWKRRLGPIASELLSVLEGTYVVSRTGQPFRPMFMKNHASLTMDGAMEKLWPSVAKAVWKGVFEFVTRQDPLPSIIVACAAVEKMTDPFKRLVTDYRPTKIFVDAWAVKYISIRGIGLMMRRNALWWSRDRSGAYFNGVLGDACGASARWGDTGSHRTSVATSGRSPSSSASGRTTVGGFVTGRWARHALRGQCLG